MPLCASRCSWPSATNVVARGGLRRCISRRRSWVWSRSTASLSLPGHTSPGGTSRIPPVKDVGEPCAGEPRARFDGGELEKEPATAADLGGPRETEGLEPGDAYCWSLRQLPTQPSSPANTRTPTAQMPGGCCP